MADSEEEQKRVLMRWKESENAGLKLTIQKLRLWHPVLLVHAIDPYSQCYGLSSSHVRRWQLDHKEGWAWRIDAFELWCWRRLSRVPWTARRSNQSILKEISPECSFEGLMLKLKLQYFGHVMQRTDLLEKTLMLGKIEGRRRRGQQRMKWLDGSSTQWTWVMSKL